MERNICIWNKKKIYNPGNNILTLFNNLAQVQIATSKTILDIQHNKLVTRGASRVAKRLKTKDDLRTFYQKKIIYYKILEKYQILVEMQLSAQSSFQNLYFGNNCQKNAKLDNTFLKSCPILLAFFILCQMFWPGLQ